MRWVACCILALGFTGPGCSRRVASTLLGLPPPADTGRAQPAAAAPAAQLAPLPVDTVRPPIERVLDPDSVVPLLPRDRSGNIDWMAALRSGVIKPRAAPPNPDRPPSPESSFEFGFDFFLPGPDSTFHAFFPHSSHTKWLSCQTCHARIFPFRGTKITMGEIFQGKYCGECHGKVAFPLVNDCERCHVNLTMPENRAPPALIGTITFSRPAPPTDTARAVAPNGAAEPTLRRAGLPPAQFPHWVHRIRYQCKACHLGIFQPRAGANRITMAEMQQGKWCGACHDGATAFAAGFGTCERCHIPESAPGGS